MRLQWFLRACNKQVVSKFCPHTRLEIKMQHGQWWNGEKSVKNERNKSFSVFCVQFEFIYPSRGFSASAVLLVCMPWRVKEEEKWKAYFERRSITLLAFHIQTLYVPEVLTVRAFRLSLSVSLSAGTPSFVCVSVCKVFETTRAQEPRRVHFVCQSPSLAYTYTRIFKL